MASLDVRSGMLGVVAGAGLAYLLFKAKGGAPVAKVDALKDRKFIGVDVGGTTVSVGLMRDDGTMISKDQTVLKDTSFKTVLGDIVALCNKVVSSAGIEMNQVTAIGVGFPGNLNREKGLIVNAANFEGWSNEPICRKIAESTGVANVLLENDANAALLAEWWVGAAKGCSSVAMVTLGTGVGGGLILHNKLVMGANMMAAEVGHCIMDINGEQYDPGTAVHGIVERYCSARAVGLQAAERLGMVAQGKVSTGKLPSGTGFSWDASKAKASSLLPVFQENGVVECKEVFDHMAKGDEFATETLDEVFERIAVLCINICRVVDPQRIVLTGGMVLAGDALLEPLRAKFKKHHWKILPVTTEIIPATTGNDAGMIGAAASARAQLR